MRMIYCVFFSATKTRWQLPVVTWPVTWLAKSRHEMDTVSDGIGWVSNCPQITVSFCYIRNILCLVYILTHRWGSVIYSCHFLKFPMNPNDSGHFELEYTYILGQGGISVKNTQMITSFLLPVKGEKLRNSPYVIFSSVSNFWRWYSLFYSNKKREWNQRWSWRRPQMETWPVNSHHKGPVTRSFDVFFDLRLKKKRLSKQSPVI